MIKLTIEENLVTDLRSYGINISKDAINALPYDIDIQNSDVEKMDLTSPSDIRKKSILVSDDKNVIAIYISNKFFYNPKKIKVSDVMNYNCWEVVNNPGSVAPKRLNRETSRQDYIDLHKSTTAYNKPPKSIRYVLDRDWNPEINRQYYIKVLHQNRLDKYAQQLDYTYTIMEDLINHRRKEQTVGKKGVYTNWIKKLASQIETAETLMDALDKNVNPDIPKLLKSLKTLENTTKQAYDFLKYEDETIASFGYTKKRNPVPITR